MAIRAVWFDVGGTLVDETRMFTGWAAWLDVEPIAFMAAVGATIEARTSHRKVFDMVAPGLDVAEAQRARRAAGRHFLIEPRDLYPDAASCIAACRAAGLLTGIAGNQPEDALAALERCGLGAHHLATSAGWGVSKPDPAFFDRIVAASGVAAHEIAYVGDRVDNDVLPARAAGMAPVLVLRGPWGVIQGAWPEAAQAASVVRTLADLPAVLASLERRSDAAHVVQQIEAKPAADLNAGEAARSVRQMGP